jgi:hypothetical protein
VPQLTLAHLQAAALRRARACDASASWLLPVHVDVRYNGGRCALVDTVLWDAMDCSVTPLQYAALAVQEAGLPPLMAYPVANVMAAQLLAFRDALKPSRPQALRQLAAQLLRVRYLQAGRASGTFGSPGPDPLSALQAACICDLPDVLSLLPNAQSPAAAAAEQHGGLLDPTPGAAAPPFAFLKRARPSQRLRSLPATDHAAAPLLSRTTRSATVATALRLSLDAASGDAAPWVPRTVRPLGVLRAWLAAPQVDLSSVTVSAVAETAGLAETLLAAGGNQDSETAGAAVRSSGGSTVGRSGGSGAASLAQDSPGSDAVQTVRRGRHVQRCVVAVPIDVRAGGHRWSDTVTLRLCEFLPSRETCSCRLVSLAGDGVQSLTPPARHPPTAGGAGARCPGSPVLRYADGLLARGCITTGLHTAIVVALQEALNALLVAVVNLDFERLRRSRGVVHAASPAPSPTRSTVEGKAAAVLRAVDGGQPASAEHAIAASTSPAAAAAAPRISAGIDADGLPVLLRSSLAPDSAAWTAAGDVIASTAGPLAAVAWRAAGLVVAQGAPTSAHMLMPSSAVTQRTEPPPAPSLPQPVAHALPDAVARLFPLQQPAAMKA